MIYLISCYIGSRTRLYNDRIQQLGASNNLDDPSTIDLKLKSHKISCCNIHLVEKSFWNFAEHVRDLCSVLNFRRICWSRMKLLANKIWGDQWRQKILRDFSVTCISNGFSASLLAEEFFKNEKKSKNSLAHLKRYKQNFMQIIGTLYSLVTLHFYLLICS